MKSQPSLKKAAILVASLDRETADSFLQRLPENTAALVRDEILTLSDQDLDCESNVIQGPRVSRPLRCFGDALGTALAAAHQTQPAPRVEPEQPS